MKPVQDLGGSALAGEAAAGQSRHSLWSALVVALLLSLGTAVSLGFGRFAYALLLVPMQRDLGWSYARSGLINSAHSLGYLAGVLALGPLLTRWGAARAVRVGLALAALSLLVTGLTANYPLLLLLRLLAGIGAGLVYIGGAPIVVQLAAPGVASAALSLYYAGPGLGMLIAGLAAPLFLREPGGWRLAWLAMGLFGLLALALMEAPIRRARRGEVARPATEAAFVLEDYRRLWPTLAAFTLFGLGYIGYMTFIVAYIAGAGAPPALVQIFWIVLACGTLAGVPFWAALTPRLRPHNAILAILITLAVGALLPVLVPQGWSYICSGVLFGGTFLALIAAITRQVRYVTPERWAPVVSNTTALFAAGQLFGPALTGLVADMPGGLALGLAASGGLLGLAALTVVFGPRPRPNL